MKLRSLLVMAVLAASGCKINIQVPPTGEVGTDDFTCAAGETCVVEASTPSFFTTYVAQPYPGYKFDRWKSESGYLCGGNTDPACVVDLRFFAGNPSLEALLVATADVDYFMEPIFVEDEASKLPDPVRHYPMNDGVLIDAVSGLSGLIDGAIAVQDRNLAQDSALLLYNRDVNAVEPVGSIPGINEAAFLAMPGLESISEFTVAFFVNSENPGVGPSRDLLRVGELITLETSEYYLTLRFGELFAQLPQGDGQLLADGNWHHIAMSYNGDVLGLYFDGDELMTLATDGSPGNIDQILVPWANGAVDEMFAFDRALNPLQIARLSDGWEPESSQVDWLPITAELPSGEVELAASYQASFLIGNILNTAGEGLAISVWLSEDPDIGYDDTQLSAVNSEPLFPGTSRTVTYTLNADQPIGRYYIGACAYPIDNASDWEDISALPEPQCSEGEAVDIVEPGTSDLAITPINYASDTLTVEVTNLGENASRAGTVSLIYTYFGIEGALAPVAVPELAPGETVALRITDNDIDIFAQDLTYSVCVATRFDENTENDCAAGRLSELFTYDLTLEIVDLDGKATVRVTNEGMVQAPAGVSINTISSMDASQSEQVAIPALGRGMWFEYESLGGATVWQVDGVSTFEACLDVASGYPEDSNLDNSCDSRTAEIVLAYDLAVTVESLARAGAFVIVRNLGLGTSPAGSITTVGSIADLVASETIAIPSLEPGASFGFESTAGAQSFIEGVNVESCLVSADFPEDTDPSNNCDGGVVPR